MKVTQSWKSASWKGKTLVVLALLFVLYTLVGFFVVPGLVKDNARQALADLTGRDVTISEVRFNPLVLSAEVDGFAIADEQTEVLAGFDRLYVNFQLSSLFRWTWYFDEISVEGLTLRAQRNPESVFNFDDVIAHAQAQFAEDPAEPEPVGSDEDEGGLPSLAIATMTLTNGDLRYTEATGKEPHQLTLPVAFTVSNFSTVSKGEGQNDYAIRLEGPDGGVFDWNGHFEFSPFVANGRLQVQGVDLVSLARLGAEQVRFTVPSGELDVEAEYAFNAEPDAQLMVSKGQVVLRDLAIQNPAEETPSLLLPQVKVSGVAVDTLSQTVNIPEVLINQPHIRAILGSAGLDLATLFLPPDPDEAEERKQVVKEKAQQAAERIAEAETLWVLHLDALKVDGNRFEFVDRTLNPAQTVMLEEGVFTLKDLVVGEESPFSWEGAATVLGEGKLSHTGKGQLAPLSINTSASLTALPLAPLSPWLEREMPLRLAAGSLGLELNTAVEGESPDFTVTGDVAVDGLNLLENGSPLLKLNQTRIKGLSLSTANQQVGINEIALTGMDMLHRIDNQGRDASARIEAGTRPAPAAQGSESSAPWQVGIKRVRLVGSQVRHEDLSVSPNFKIGLYQLSGVVSNLSTRPGSRASLDLNAQVDRYAPFSIKGSLSPEPLFTDMNVSLKNYEMTGLTPFTGHYLGYKVEKGQLGVDTEVSIENRHLDSVTDIQADQFYLGEKVPSDEAVKAPVKLGLSVLRSRSGEITLPVKMSGDLDDPSFSVSGMILKVLTNIIVKAATAPFSVLAGLAGGENLEQITFTPGSAEVGPQTLSSLDALSKVLAEKPHLNIGLVGTTNADDRTALAAQRVGDDIDGRDWTSIDVAVQDKRLRRKLIRRYESETDNEVETLVSASLPEEEEAADAILARAAWDAMVTQEAQAVTREQLVELARLRSENAKAALVQEFEVAQARVYLNESTLDGEVSGLTLTLEK